MTLLRKYYSPGVEGGGIPDEEQSKIDNLCNLNQEPLYREGVFDGYFIASEELTSLKEEVEYLTLKKETVYAVLSNSVKRKRITIKELKEENERLRGGGWISIDNPPKKTGDYLVYDINGFNPYIYVYRFTETGHWVNDAGDAFHPTHWHTPIPSPTKK